MRPTIRCLIVTLALALTACGGSSASIAEQSDCELWVENAAVIDPMRDAIEDLDPAIRRCSSIAELEAASAKYPDAFDGVAVREFLRNRCTDPALAPAAVCRELGE